MIQIQDDTVNQVVAPVSSTAPGSTSQMYQQLIQTTKPTQSVQSTQSIEPTGDEKNSNSDEIDKLLAELDKLSKNLEEKPVAATTTPPAPTTQVVPADQAQPIQETEDKSTEKFDFDSFLSDLEKKIDQETNKNKTAENDNQPMADFRKNRPTMDLQEGDEEKAVPVAPATVDAAEKPAVESNDNEELKSQNIFEMLGLMSISDSEKNQFLDELEAMIWDDFIVHDLELLLTSEEYNGARQILDDQGKKDDEKKEALIVYLEKLVPDLDEVLYEKALELKSEMMGERLSKMKESTDQAILAKVKEAESLISQNHWKSAASLLNQLS